MQESVSGLRAADRGRDGIDSANSAGGYKDWFVTTTDRLGLTVEIGAETTPYDQIADGLDEIVRAQARTLEIASECARQIARE